MQNLLWEYLDCVKQPSLNESCGFVYNLMNYPFVIEFVLFFGKYHFPKMFKCSQVPS